MTAARALAATAIGLALLAACGDDGGDERSDTSSSTSSSSTSTTASSTTTTVAPLKCPIDPLGSAIEEPTTAEGDVDGDGEVDELTSYRDADGWHMRVDLASGGGADSAVAVSGAEPVSVMGGADANGDGGDEVWAQAGSGASTDIIGLFRYGDCALTEVTIDGQPARFPVGASVANASGVECRDDTVVAISGSSQDGVTFSVTETSYELQESELVEVDTSTSSVAASSPGFQRLSSFRCDDLTL